MSDLVWWLVVLRLLLGIHFFALAVRLVLQARDELTFRFATGENGMQAEILSNEISYRKDRAVFLAAAWITALLVLPGWEERAARMGIGQVVGAGIWLSLTVSSGYMCLIKRTERERLYQMAQKAKKP